MDLEKKLADLEARYAKEREALVKEHAVRSALPSYAEDYKPRVHFHSLYGRDASVSFKYDFFAYGKDVKQPDLSLLEQLAKDLPAVPLVKVYNGCTSFRTKAHVEALPETDKERWESETDIAPFTVKVSAFQQQTVEISWITQLAGFMVEVEVTLPLPASVGRFDIAISKHMGGKRIARCDFSLGESLRELRRQTADMDEAIAGAERVKWASGSPETPNDFTFYWTPYRDDVPPAVSDLVSALKA